MCVPRCLVVKFSPVAPKGPSSKLGSTFFLRFFFFFFFSCSFHFRYNSFVMFLYIAHNFWLTNFFSPLYLPFPPSPFARSCDLRISSLQNTGLVGQFTNLLASCHSDPKTNEKPKPSAGLYRSLTSLLPICIRTAKFVRWLQEHVISLSIFLTNEHPLLDQYPFTSDLQ